MLKEKDIKEFLESNGISYKEKSSVWGTAFLKKSAYLLGPAAALTMQYHVVHLNNEGLAVIGINNLTGKIEQGAIAFIPNHEIKSVRFQKKMISFKLEIEAEKGTLAYKVNKVMVGASWHKENLGEILKRYT